jgi:hypothetical protein
MLLGSAGLQYGPMAVIIEDGGRTYLAKKLGRFLNWTGHQAKSELEFFATIFQKCQNVEDVKS